MAMIYALVARGTDVLAEYTSSGLTGNFSQVTRVLLKKIPNEDGRLSYVYDKYIFHYMVSDHLTYLVMTDGDFSRQVAFQFLAEIQKRFVATYGDRGKTALAFAFNADFERVLQAQMDLYNKRKEDSKIASINQDISIVKNVMIENIDKVLLRGEKIELLVDKSDQLDQHAMKFKTTATNLKRAMWWKNAKICIVIILVLIIIIYAILAASCGGLDLHKC